MEVYYRRLMGNGTVASKFKLDTGKRPRSPDPHALPGSAPSDGSAPHHNSNCSRCYRLKKKCSRTYPLCEYCLRLNSRCEYVSRKKKKKDEEDLALDTPAPQNGTAALSLAALTPQPSAAESPSAASTRLDSAEGLLAVGSLSRHPPILPKPGSFEQKHESLTSSDSNANTIATNGNAQLVGNSGLPILIASLVHQDETEETFRNIDLPTTVLLPAKERRLPSRASPPADKEFLVVRAIPYRALPQTLLNNFFASYELRYPVVLRADMESKASLLFANDTLVPYDVYLVMAVGALICDSTHDTQHYGAYFSDAMIESVINILLCDVHLASDPDKLPVWTLLALWALNSCNGPLLWHIVGFIDRLVVANSPVHGPSQIPHAWFWATFSIDKELSLVLDRWSQFPPELLVKTPPASDGKRSTAKEMTEAWIALYKLQARTLELRHRPVGSCGADLTQLLLDLDTWRAATLQVIHTHYADQAVLQSEVGLVNLDYYYLLVELDQASATELGQFTLQFLLSLFSLLLPELKDAAESLGCSLHTHFWFLKLFRVMDYAMESLARTLAQLLSRAQLGMRLNEFSSNAQLMVNLLRFLLDGRAKAGVRARLESYAARLKHMTSVLAGFNPLLAQRKDVDRLASELRFEVS